ncbi:Serine/threonine-protein kinase PknD [Pontiella desulfatans]|uniref:Serine/threonine-protein kinase PknD n=1 Tax=Pontiella desulfatans TaxID=2750659 RepID=A0A6C2UA76_PONDE|nr:serine/threonine-protein kinase [Pontiella desulfatans]VGO16940.1 Serine/threonine-protein kinase PknD [Pontiella desulfatans]
MSEAPFNNDELDGMARMLSSMYGERVSAEDSEGTIHAELRASGDRYTDAEVLARGGMKKVSRVFDTKTGRQVAMAELRAHAPAELYEPFLREARLTALLEHPNIISIHDIGLFPDGRPFFTMDLKRGDSLANILRKNKMPREQLLEIFVKLCDALSYAHSQKVLHLDLKPENIQVGRFGEVFICDWGLGKIADGDESDGQEFDLMLFNPDLLNNMTLSGELKGTPGYMAPEQFEKGGVKTFQTDVFALGCMLYAILTQQPPFKGNLEEIREQTLAGKVVSPAKAFPKKNVPAGLNAVVMKALNPKPAHRYTSAAELRDDVKNFLSGFSTSAENAGLIKESALFFKRNRAACLVGLMALLVVVATTVLFIQQLQGSLVDTRQAHELAEIRREEADTQRQEAEALRIEAETASALYREELDRNLRLIGSVAENREQQLFRQNLDFIYLDPVLAIELSLQQLNLLAREAPSPYYSGEIGFRHFIRQEFAVAEDHLKRGGKSHIDLWELSRKYKNRKSGHLLNLDWFAELIGDLKASKMYRTALMERMLVYDDAVREDKTGYEKVVEAVLRGWNNRWTEGRFEYDPENASLELSGINLKRFVIQSNVNSGESPLRFINIRTLDVHHTGLQDLNQIKTLRIQSLDISNTEVVDLKPISLFPALKTLIVAPNQFTDAQLAALPSTISVSIR